MDHEPGRIAAFQAPAGWDVEWAVKAPKGLLNPNDETADAFALRLKSLAEKPEIEVLAEVLSDGVVTVFNEPQPAIVGYIILTRKKT